MAAFVSIAEYLAYAGDTVNMDRAEYDLETACDTIRDYLGQTIDLVTADAVTLYGTDTRAMLLPELPVVSIASVVKAAEDWYPAETITDYRVDAYGVLWRDWPSYWLKPSAYTVTYTHGYAPANVPSILKVAAFRLAGLGGPSFQASGGVAQEAIAGYSVTYDNLSTVAAARKSEYDAILAMLDQRVVKKVPTP